ncbi:hypothetical protein [Steroidobacter sp.]|uniref:hypothetical protein n=1 Tax=Steroidobacter sp. TaxID=1978227 RepID=UPI001A5870D5|nr:hypothetical protein [Steroidobacter sp.]MBL8266271.1 response regulator transcription factor [Steroidobacter sp.]
MPPVVDILIVTSDAVSDVSDILSRAGISNRTVPSLAGVFKAARSYPPQAVIVDMTRSAADMGTDHIVRTLRQTYPSLTLVALCSAHDRRIDALAAEFKLPVLTQPVVAADLLAALRVTPLQLSAAPRARSTRLLAAGSTNE